MTTDDNLWQFMIIYDKQDGLLAELPGKNLFNFRNFLNFSICDNFFEFSLTKKKEKRNLETKFIQKPTQLRNLLNQRTNVETYLT